MVWRKVYHNQCCISMCVVGANPVCGENESKRAIDIASIVVSQVNDMKEQLNERKLQVEELQLQLGKREEELAQSLMRIDEEGAGN